MVIFIRLYPIFAACVAFVAFDFARNLRRKGKSYWLVPALFCIIFLVSILMWWIYRGDQNAEQWAQDWASLNISQYTHFV
jgi:putative effector of murein hydrolase